MTENTAVKTLTVVDSVKKLEPEFKLALPDHIPSEKFTRIAVSAVNSNPELLGQDIDKRSLFASCMKAAQDGLVLDNREAALVTFKSKNGTQVTYIPMVAGIMKKMRNSGEISNISHGLVYQREFDEGRFEYIKGDNESLKHEPILFGNKGDLIGVYAVVTLKDGAKVRAFMDMDQVKKVRANSRGGNSEYSPWNKWFEEMCIKSVLRKVSKLCPQSSDLDQVFRHEDNDNEDVKQPDFDSAVAAEDTPKRPRKSTADRVKAAVVNEMAVTEPRSDVIDIDFSEGESLAEDREIPM